MVGVDHVGKDQAAVAMDRFYEQLGHGLPRLVMTKGTRCLTTRATSSSRRWLEAWRMVSCRRGIFSPEFSIHAAEPFVELAGGAGVREGKLAGDRPCRR